MGGRLPAVSCAALVFLQLSLFGLCFASSVTSQSQRNGRIVENLSQREAISGGKETPPPGRPSPRASGERGTLRHVGPAHSRTWVRHVLLSWPPLCKQDFRVCVTALRGVQKPGVRIPSPPGPWSPATESWPGRRRLRTTAGPAGRSRCTRSCSTCLRHCWASSARSWTAATARWAGEASVSSARGGGRGAAWDWGPPYAARSCGRHAQLCSSARSWTAGSARPGVWAAPPGWISHPDTLPFFVLERIQNLLRASQDLPLFFQINFGFRCKMK